MIKGKGVSSSIINGIATFAYMIILVDIEKSFIVALATTIGSLISFKLSSHFEKDKVWIFDITPNTNDKGKEFADNIRENNIPIMTYVGFNANKEKVICSKIYSHSKEHSRLIEDIIPSSFKYHISEVKNYIE